jgi:hypothetical protein
MRKDDPVAFGEGKKEAPAIDEGEEARLCGGLWTKLLNEIVPGEGRHVNSFDEIFSKNLFLGEPAGEKSRVPAARSLGRRPPDKPGDALS